MIQHLRSAEQGCGRFLHWVFRKPATVSLGIQLQLGMLQGFLRQKQGYLLGLSPSSARKQTDGLSMRSNSSGYYGLMLRSSSFANQSCSTALPGFQISVLAAPGTRQSISLQVRVVEFDGNTPFEVQLQAISETGVFVSVHTSNLANAQFLQPGSAVIEIIQRNWGWHEIDRTFQASRSALSDSIFDRLATQAWLEKPVLDSCWQEVLALYLRLRPLDRNESFFDLDFRLTSRFLSGIAMPPYSIVEQCCSNTRYTLLLNPIGQLEGLISRRML